MVDDAIAEVHVSDGPDAQVRLDPTLRSAVRRALRDLGARHLGAPVFRIVPAFPYGLRVRALYGSGRVRRGLNLRAARKDGFTLGLCE